jgi:8-oxo-dGTP pyrophosphatase MutT (NUDIX family)
MRVHSGQVALPGGKQEASDPDLVTTALREAHEEIGLPPRVVRILGTADDYITSTGFVVTPVVGWIMASFTPMPNPSEASRVFCAPLSVFRDSGALRAIPWEPLRGLIRAYEVDGEVIWGVTAAILSALVTRVAVHPEMPGF